MNREHNDFITPELLQEIPYFENFLDKIGFKRIDGAVFGLLVLSSRSLCSEEIEKTLQLSQSAVSQSLKSLAHFGALESTEPLGPRSSRTKYHTAKENALSIVSSVFRKREQESIEEFKQMAKRSLKKCRDPKQAKRTKRLESIVATCQLAEEVIKFVINVAQIENQEVYKQIVSRVPKAFNLILTSTTTPLGQATSGWALKFKDSFVGGLNRITDSNSKDVL